MTRIAIVLLTLILYYSLIVHRIAPLWIALARRLRLGRRRSDAEVTAVVRLFSAGISQLLLFFALVWANGLGARDLGLAEIAPLRLVYGVLLGVGEMAVASFLGHVAIRTAMSLSKDAAQGPRALEDWLIMARGGWMRHYLKTAEAAPLPIATVLILLYVSVEELIFRSVLLTLVAPFGGAAAIGVSTGVFSLVQAFHMPSWRSAIFPMLGALLVGILHGALFLAVPDILPLILAHAVFFAAAIR